MVPLMENIVDEMQTLPVYFQERAARRMNEVLHDIIVEMLLWDHEANTRYEREESLQDGGRV